MAFDAVTRELLIKLGLLGQAETKAGLDSTTESVDKLGAAGADTASRLETGTVAENAQATALENLQQALLTATVAMKDLGDTTVAGGAPMKAALLEARDAVAQLEIAIEAARAQGGPVSPAAIAALELYDARIKALTLSIEASSAATAAAASSQKVFSIEASIARDSVGGLARGVATWGGSMASALLPALLIPAAIDLIVRGLGFLNKQTEEGAAKLVGWAFDLNEADIATRKHGESLEAYATRLKQVSDAKDDAVRASIAMGAGMVRETADVDAARAAWQGHEAAIHGNFDQYPAFVAAMKAMGLTFTETHEKMRQEAQTFGQAYNTVLKMDGIAAANAWAVNAKGVADKIVSYFQRIGEEVPSEMKKVVEALGPGFTSTAEKATVASAALHDKFVEDANVAAVLGAEIQRLATVFGSEEAAVKALAPEILHLLDLFEKLKGLNAADEAQRREIVASLTALAAKYGLVEGEMKKLLNTADKLVASFKDQKLKLAELSLEYDAHVKAVTRDADLSIAAVNREADEVRITLQKQLESLKQQHNDMAISDHDYFEKVNLITAAMNLAANAAQAERERINEKERLDLSKLAEHHRETAGKIEDSMKKITDAHAAAAAGVQHSSEQMSTEIDAMSGKAKSDLSQMEEEIKKTGSSFTDMATKAADAGQNVVPIIRDLSTISATAAEKLGEAAKEGNLAAEMLVAIHEAGNPIPGLLGAIADAAARAFGGASATGTDTSGAGAGGGF